MIYTCTKFNKIPKSSQSYEVNAISILNNTKRHNSAKLKLKLWILFSAHHLMKLYICTQFHENIFDSFKVLDLTEFSY